MLYLYIQFARWLGKLSCLYFLLKGGSVVGTVRILLACSPLRFLIFIFLWFFTIMRLFVRFLLWTAVLITIFGYSAVLDWIPTRCLHRRKRTRTEVLLRTQPTKRWTCCGTCGKALSTPRRSLRGESVLPGVLWVALWVLGGRRRQVTEEQPPVPAWPLLAASLHQPLHSSSLQSLPLTKMSGVMATGSVYLDVVLKPARPATVAALRWHLEWDRPRARAGPLLLHPDGAIRQGSRCLRRGPLAPKRGHTPSHGRNSGGMEWTRC